MRRIVTWLPGLLLIATLPVLAQTAARDDVLSTLLTEVRLLRQTLEKTTTVAPQMQLLASRLSVQNLRLQSAIRDHEAARVALQENIEETTRVSAQLQALTDDPPRSAADPVRKMIAEQQEAALKAQLADLSTREPRLRAREAELAAVVADEQNQWAALNRRLDDLERALAK